MLPQAQGIAFVDDGAERAEAAEEVHLLHLVEGLAAEERDAVFFPRTPDARENRIVDGRREIDAVDGDADRRREGADFHVQSGLHASRSKSRRRAAASGAAPALVSSRGASAYL